MYNYSKYTFCDILSMHTCICSHTDWDVGGKNTKELQIWQAPHILHSVQNSGEKTKFGEFLKFYFLRLSLNKSLTYHFRNQISNFKLKSNERNSDKEKFWKHSYF